MKYIEITAKVPKGDYNTTIKAMKLTIQIYHPKITTWTTWVPRSCLITTDTKTAGWEWKKYDVPLWIAQQIIRAINDRYTDQVDYTALQMNRYKENV